MPKNPKEEEAAPAASGGSAAEPSTEKGGKKDRPEKADKSAKGKDAGKAKGKGKAPAGTTTEKKGGKPIPDNPNFRYIVRVANSDLDGRRAVALALTGVRGVGMRIAEATCRLAHVNPNEMIGNLPEPTVESIETTLSELPAQVPLWMVNHPRDYAAGATLHDIGPELETARRDDVNMMKMIRSYRGVRHERGQKVRGQRTRSNGRTGMAAGVMKKAAKEAAAAKSKEEGGGPAPAAAPAAAKAPLAGAAKAAAAPAKDGAAPAKGAAAPAKKE